MDVKQAVGMAKRYVADLFIEEDLQNIGLEEVDFDDASGEWLVTIGFSRPWDRPGGVLAGALNQRPAREYKVVRIEDQSQRVVSVMNREPAA